MCNNSIMHFITIGHISPECVLSTSHTHLSVPIVEILDEDKKLIKIYFSCRNSENISEFRNISIVISNSISIKTKSNSLFNKGKIGTFDDCGVTVCSIVNAIKSKKIFYQGWNKGVTIPNITAIGIAEMKNESINRINDGPIMSRTFTEPYSCASPFVIFDEGIYKMWYVSMDRWENTNTGLKHYYDIRYAVSKNGIDWKRSNIRCITYQNEREYAFGRPFVIKENNKYKMWYCYRGDYYKIGYAESLDGISWERKDNLIIIDTTLRGWDSEMQAYPCIFDLNNNRYLVYNGNNYGKTGLGIARMI